MERVIQKLKTLLEIMGFNEARVNFDETHRKISIFIEDEIIRKQIPNILPAFDCLVNLIARQEGENSVIVDLNYYRKERERLIIELARAAARKALATQTPIELPPMNAYERRLVHMEITTHPDLTTESIGQGKERRVVVKKFIPNESKSE